MRLTPLLASLVFAGVAAAVPVQDEIKVTTRRPVLAVVEQLRQRHGWRISYEDDALAGAEPYVLAFSYPAASSEPTAVLQRLVTAHAALGQGAFRVEESIAALHIVPSAGSVLDTKVTLHTDATSPRDVVEAVCLAVSGASGRRVIAGRVAVIHSRRVPVRGEGEPARAVLTRALAEFDAPLAWDLIYSPELGGYILTAQRLFVVTSGRRSH